MHLISKANNTGTALQLKSVVVVQASGILWLFFELAFKRD